MQRICFISVVNTTTFIAKPHVAAFLKRYYFDKDLHLPRLKDPMLIEIIRHNLTDLPMERLQDVPQGYETLLLLLPPNMRYSYLKADQAIRIAMILETHFWIKAIEKVRQYMIEASLYKDESIKLFYKVYGISESQYAIGNFRRKMNRAKVSGTHVEDLDLHPRISRKLSNQKCKQMARIRRTRGISLRTLADKYQLSHQQVQNITKKIYPNLS